MNNNILELVIDLKRLLEYKKLILSSTIIIKNQNFLLQKSIPGQYPDIALVAGQSEIYVTVTAKTSHVRTW